MSQQRKRVLVVEDEPVVLTVVCRLLEAAGFLASAATCARGALPLLEIADRPVDLVLTDVVMPETDGRALGLLISERHPDLPVLYMSAYPENDVFHRGAPSPGLPFLRKPFSPEMLVAAVQRLLEVGPDPGSPATVK
jgi:two-component system, cell cycle sensor histidine kinase and response regulator CckA